MKVRCGACRTEFDVTGAGRHACPACGAVNQVTAEAAETPSPQQMMPQAPLQQQPGGFAPPSMPEAAPTPSALPKVTCPECSFEFVVGDIEVASCPNCSAEVPV